MPTPSDNDYKQIKQEIESGNLQEDLWMRALAQSRGDQTKAFSFYISLRGEQVYRENTSFYKRSADSAKDLLDLRSHRGQAISTAILLGVCLIILFAVQPALKASAAREYQTLYAKAKAAGIIGNTASYLFKQLGKPDRSLTTDSSLVHVYNASSAFCFDKGDYELKVYVDLRTGRISGIGAID